MFTSVSWLRLGVLCLATALAWCSLAPAQTTPVSPTKQSQTSFKAGGTPIRVDRFEPAKEGKYPAIIVLPGADDLEQTWKLYRDEAEVFAKKGYVILFVHYFERSGHGKSDLVKLLKQRIIHYFDPANLLQPEEKKVLAKHFVEWSDTVAEAVAFAGRDNSIDPKRVSVVGFSLGGGLALYTAAQEDPQNRRTAAVVSLFGGLPVELRSKATKLPPTLLLQGDLDNRVPPREAYALETHLRKHKAPEGTIELKMYQRTGHMFEPGSPFDMLDARNRVEAFLKKHPVEK